MSEDGQVCGEIIGVHEGILLERRKKFALKIAICPKNRHFALKLQKIYHLNTLHLYLAKTNKDSKTNKERGTDFLYQAVELPTSDCSIFTENEGLVQTKVTITNYDFGPDYKLHGSPSEYTLYWKIFTVHDFGANCAFPEKTELLWKFSLYWIYFYIQDF